MPLREQFSLAWAARHDRVDVFHSPALTAPIGLSCPLVLTLHDTIWHQSPVPDSSSSAKRVLLNSYYRRVSEYATRRAAVIITVSNAAKSDIVSQLGISAARIVVTHEAAAPIFTPLGDSVLLEAVRLQYSLPPRFIMAIGSADPRKNVEGLVDAYACLPEALRSQYHLTIVWTHSQSAERTARHLQSLGLAQQYHFVHSPTERELALLYNAATLFVFPSWYEGFGLPPLEAMACGTAVIAANNSSIPEIVGDGALLFDARRPEELAQLMMRLLFDDRERAKLAQRGFRRASTFSWACCARKTIAAYRSAIATG